MSNKQPVLFIIFNRPDVSVESFQLIKQYKPERLYIAADGARTHKPGEKELCEKTRNAVLDQIDWDCKVFKFFREENVGCGRNVSGAISWMFETEEYGIIIEDDCLVTEDFFPFCEELLPRYKDDDRVAMINCFMFNSKEKEADTYYFTGYPLITAWGTWKRAWKNIDVEMTNWKEIRWKTFKRFPFVEAVIHFLLWRQLYRKIQKGKVANAWGYQWSIYVFMNNKLCINSPVNLVKNLGDVDATNCADPNYIIFRTQYGKLNFPLKHPKEVAIDKEKEKECSRNYVKNYSDVLKSKILRTLKLR